jgi:tetratricopeptide (TPR) repeat protein
MLLYSIRQIARSNPSCPYARGVSALRLIVLVAALLVLGSRVASAAATSGSNTEAAVPLAGQGIEAYDAGDYAAATTNLTQAQAIAPDNSAIALYLGLAYLKQGNLSAAIGAWDKYISLKPSTETEKTNGLQDTVTRDLTILLREQNHQLAETQIANERDIGPPDPDAVAITYYRNLGSPELTPLQKGLTALVIADVSKVPNLKVVERDRMQALLDEMKLGSSGLVDPKTAARAGHLLGAGRVVTGSYLDPQKGQMRIDSTLLETGALNSASNQSASGPIVHFYDIEEQLSAAILRDLGYTESDLKARGLWQAVQTPQTTNYDAFVAFSRGLDAKDHQDYANARKFFKQALVDDPSFVLALQELDRTPLQGASVADVASSVGAQAPGAAAVSASLSGGATVGAVSNLPPIVITTIPPVPPPPPPPPVVVPSLNPSFPD